MENIGDAVLCQGDCLDRMRDLPAGSVDMVLCDLPYGTTQCKWDAVIPFEPLWEQYRRVAKRNAAIVLTAAQPFASTLVMSNLQLFKYDWIWRKNLGTGFLNAKKQPLRAHEHALVFYAEQSVYNPQFTAGKPYRVVSGRQTENYGAQVATLTESDGRRYPLTVVDFARDHEKHHPTQKPVALMEYLIRTYTNPGDVVLDNTMGSGTTGVAAMRTGRRFIGIEQDPKYFQIAKSRIGYEWLFEGEEQAA